MIYSGRSQHSEPSYIIIFMSVFFSLYVNDLYTIPILTNSSHFSIINTAHIDLQNQGYHLMKSEKRKIEERKILKDGNLNCCLF